MDAEPFSHIVIDDFLEEEAANALLAEFEQQRDWSHYNHFNERKMGLPEFSALGTRTQAIVHELSSEAFLQYLVDLSGIDGLLADPDLDGGGLHQIERGGYLNVHADFQSHTTRPMWSRQLNLLLYLNNDWQDDWEGDLELWDAEVSRAVKRVKPIFNRCIVFTPQPHRCTVTRSPWLARPGKAENRSRCIIFAMSAALKNWCRPTIRRGHPITR